MALTFNAVLEACGVDPEETRLLRHQTTAFEGRTLYTLWRDTPDDFLRYQSIQTRQSRSRLGSPFWAAFVVTPAASTMFVGIWKTGLVGTCPESMKDPLDGHDVTGLDLYSQQLVEASEEYAGRVVIDWGSGTRSWAQRARRQPKPILEIARSFTEEQFPGYTRFVSCLSAIDTLPSGWLSALGAARGVYLLTCRRTKEQYVGFATGQDGILGRWLSYVRTGHGGNEGLKSRDASDYQVSILEVSGSAATVEEIIAAEELWKAKLQSREMGLNRN